MKTKFLALALLAAVIAAPACNQQGSDWPSEPGPLGLTLIAPTAATTFHAGQDAVLTFAFDADAANEVNAWIEVYFDGQQAGMCAGTSIDSPYDFDIPAAALKTGKHTATIKLLKRQDGEHVAVSEMTVPVVVEG